ncbi:MerR family transcriptional regulator [Lactobacillus sp. ESL0236]|uniref:MerR family transcriptional regulator n=1 Tax=unclassified Lactobacillus TaxID=2620435 RepID=UPI000EFC1734|nr:MULTISPECIES: MerR family transcriptional regulator [unclassified Lactobacillus]RMC38636.1 MerR family transcriptional regulator [Lactobacillus sp. ESL0237]RMC42981.1 MerR family transcriptional regulator [Lactobacillus sp. ESL0234]RMC43835.1 MerR family transcriptional regulator [Lactobacillus sp. ESL0236]
MRRTNKYRIGQFSQVTHLPAATLRYYEQEGLLAPKRDSLGQRFYTDADLAWLNFILHLKDTGMTITDLKKYVDLRAQGDETISQRLALLKQVQVQAEAQLFNLKNSLTIVKQKIAWYEGKKNATIADDETFVAYLNRIRERKQND